MTGHKGHAAIIGCGLMGCDIAAIFLAGGWRVTAVEPHEAVWPKARARMAASIGQLGADPKLAENASIVALPRAVTYADVACVVEAIPEKLPLKQALFAELDLLVPPGVPIGSNTSSFPITAIAGDCATRDRMANLHFFLPAHLVPGVEVVRGTHTTQAAVDRLAEIMASLGRVPIKVAKDIPGFLANRIQHALMREAWNLIDQGLGTAEDVDNAVRYCFGFRYLAAGPIMQKELAGLETQLAAARTIYPSLHNGSEPPAVLEQLVAENRLGPKTGRGFWDWTEERAAAERARYERALLASMQVLKGE